MAKTRWSRDEYILLLDLYKRLGKQPAYPQTLPEVVALSRDLRRMNPAAVQAYAKHRNPAGVSFYLAKMMAHDPEAVGSGLREKETASGYQLRVSVFQEFYDDGAALAAEIARIRSAYGLDQARPRPQLAAQNQPDWPGQPVLGPPAVREPASQPYGSARRGWRKWLYEWLIKLAQKL